MYSTTCLHKPATLHDLIKVLRTLKGNGHPVAILDEVQQSLGGHPGVGPLAAGDDLPEEDAVRPDVGLGAGHAVKQRLGRHPQHRQLALGHLPVVVTLLHISDNKVLVSLK